MAILQWYGENMRCFSSFRCALDPGINWFVGDNATGKTSLLEGLYYIVTGRSFRVRDTRVLIKEHCDHCVMHAVCDTPDCTIDMVRYRSGTTQAHLDGAPIRKWSELAYKFPVLFVDTHTHRQFAEYVDVRRKWFDWVMFHVEHLYANNMALYKKAMEQRMHALRQGLDPGPWEHVMYEYAVLLDKDRSLHMEALQRIWHERDDGMERVTISYHPGHEGDLAALWVKQRGDDMRRGYAQSGPHRYDVQCYKDTYIYNQRLSLGQQKIMVADLMLLAAQYVKHVAGKNILWLMDDMASELDITHTAYIVERLRALSLQSIITTLHTTYNNHAIHMRPITSIAV